MKIKVTVHKKSKQEYSRTDWESLPTGTVIEYTDGTKGVVFEGTIDKKAGIMLVCGFGGVEYGPIAADGYLTESFKVLGKLSEIIVEEN